MLAEMLRLPEADAAALAEAVAARTGGNPYDSVELVNSLRRDGILTLGDTGWTWDPAALQAFVGDGDVVDLLTARLQRLPAPARSLIDVIAVLAGDVDLGLLAVAAGEPAPRVLDQLAPALEDGLLVLERAAAVRFSHDRVQQAAAGLAPADRAALHLTAARRLAGHAEFATVAAQQYLAAAGEVREPAECRQVIGLFRLAAARMQLVNAVAAEQFLAAAVRLVDEVGAADREPLLAGLRTEWHAALYALGRLAEADEIYREIERRDPDPLVLVPPACVHMSSLTARGRIAEAVALALDLLRRLGLRVPDAQEMAAQSWPTLKALGEWVEHDDEQIPPERPEITDPRITAAARVINRAMPAAFFSDQRTMAWLTAEACRLWTEHGPHAALVCPIAHSVVVTAAQDDYRTGYAAVRRVLAASEARGYEPEASQARFLFAVSAGHWFEPLEDDIQQARQAYEGLVRAGDLLYACFTFHASTPSMLDSASSLDSYATEVEAGISFAARTGNEQTNSVALPFRQLVRALRDESGEPAAGFADPEYLAVTEGHPMAAAYHHITRALVAAIFADTEALRHHTAAAMPLLPYIRSHYATARAYLLRSLALAEQCRTGDPAERAGLLGELDGCRQWLARRAIDAPATFSHLVRLVDAEQAWAAGADREAAVAFDAALDEVGPRRRPWQHALIAEHAARFHLAAGTSRTGRTLLAETVQLYRNWGAAAKVRQLEEAHPFLRGRGGKERLSLESTVTTRVSVDSLDLIGVLKASQALSSETNLDSLRRRVVDVMRTLTGADRVQVLVRREAEGWFLAQDGDTAAVPAAEAGERGLLPLSAFRYAERTRTPLLVADATRDDRFARDPYVSSLDCCSLLVVPILMKGTPHAMVVLENRLVRNMFTPDRLDAVLLIAGQLAVSLENATLYASLERKVAERTQELAAANRQLQQLSVTDPLTGLANRRQLGDQLQAEWQRGLRSGTALAVAMIDVDHFKLYNDHYGHPAGDVCLRRVARAVSDTVRVEDIVARYGGEEFAIVLAGRDAEEARTAAERVRAAVEALDEPHLKSAAGRVTVSIGVAAVVPDATSSPDELIAAADAQLYQAKRAGRNRVA
jgi:diguanylate cyclase (GGDEF)-like protein